jgi:signal peptidase I
MLESLIIDSLKNGRSVRFRAPGGSMAPLIRSNDALIVEPVAPAEVSAGDIVLYRSGAGLTAHRVVGTPPPANKEGGGCFLLKGDAGSRPDPPVATSAVLGRVVAVERGGRRIDPYGFFPRLFAGLRRLASRLESRLRQAF